MIIYYINLDHRTDRREQIEKELECFDCEKVRVSAYKGGALGCSLSQIKALMLFLESGQEECIIFEDDFMFVRNPKEFEFPKNEPWDVIMLSANVMKCEIYNDTLNKVIDAQTLSGYAVHKNFAKTLLENFKESYELFRKSNYPELHAVDMYCKKLQPFSNWFVCSQKFGIQRPSWSDIESMYVNYGV